MDVTAAQACRAPAWSCNPRHAHLWRAATVEEAVGSKKSSEDDCEWPGGMLGALWQNDRPQACSAVAELLGGHLPSSPAVRGFTDDHLLASKGRRPSLGAGALRTC